MAAKQSSTQDSEGVKVVAVNKKAFHDYEILEKLECGIVLYGSEVKSLRDGRISFVDSYVRILDNRLTLLGFNIAEYAMANRLNHDPTRQRQLLAHKRQIAKLAIAGEAKGLTLVPLRMYFKRGMAKVEIGLGRGKASYDKRDSIKKREFDRQKARTMRSYSKNNK